MGNDVLGISVEDNVTRQKTVITVTVREATSTGTASIFWGVDPLGGSKGVGAAASFLAQQIIVQGAFEKGFAEIGIADASQGVTGHITVDPPLPVVVSVQLLGQSLYKLPPNTPEGDFFLTPAPPAQ